MHYLKNDGSIWFFETPVYSLEFVLLTDDELKTRLQKIAEEKKNLDPFKI